MMGRLHPTYCEHEKCIDPGDESFGLEHEDCKECGGVSRADELKSVYGWHRTEKDCGLVLREQATKIIHSLEARLDIGKDFHDLAVKERDYERLKVDRLEAERDALKAELQNNRCIKCGKQFDSHKIAR